MYHCYNEALAYMVKKFGEVKTPMSKFNSRSASTYNTDKLDDEGKEIHLLLKQYNLGMEPKKELYYIMLKKKLVI